MTSSIFNELLSPLALDIYLHREELIPGGGTNKKPHLSIDWGPRRFLDPEEARGNELIEVDWDEQSLFSEQQLASSWSSQRMWTNDRWSLLAITVPLVDKLRLQAISSYFYSQEISLLLLFGLNTKQKFLVNANRWTDKKNRFLVHSCHIHKVILNVKRANWSHQTSTKKAFVLDFVKITARR